jgi:hypothetical protein
MLFLCLFVFCLPSNGKIRPPTTPGLSTSSNFSLPEAIPGNHNAQMVVDDERKMNGSQSKHETQATPKRADGKQNRAFIELM